jgi:septum formation protein
MQPFILASTSRWRLQLLLDAGINAEAVDPEVEEASYIGNSPVETARLRAIAKARAVAERRPGSIVVGADQVIHLDGEAIGKPAGPKDWLSRLQSMRGRTHRLTTAAAIIDEAGMEVFEVTTLVAFRSDLEDDELRAYIANGEAGGCAGGYMIERRGAWLVESIDGDWLNVVGLPVLELVSRLRSRGWRMPQ